jgi:NAD(P)H-flavin reductase
MRYSSRILSIRHLTDSVAVYRFERNGFDFTPGQYLVLYIPGVAQCREYSIYSPANKPYIEILVKASKNGSFAKYLMNLEPSSEISFEGPFGFFILQNDRLLLNKYLFVATGTGISPFNSIVNTYNLLNYTILHGVRFINEAYDKGNYNSSKYILCTSCHNKGDYFGRVTSWLRNHKIDENTMCYLCGSSAMIDEVAGILETYGIQPENIKSEIFF